MAGTCGMSATTRVVVFNSGARVGRQTDIESRDCGGVSQNVDGAFSRGHADVGSKRDASEDPRE